MQLWCWSTGSLISSGEPMLQLQCSTCGRWEIGHSPNFSLQLHICYISPAHCTRVLTYRSCVSNLIFSFHLRQNVYAAEPERRLARGNQICILLQGKEHYDGLDIVVCLLLGVPGNASGPPLFQLLPSNAKCGAISGGAGRVGAAVAVCN